MSKEFNLAVFVGRFSPPHLGHLKVVETALDHADRVLVLAGSANRSRSIRTPFTVEERIEMLERMLGKHLGRVSVEALDDFMYNDYAWNAKVVSLVSMYASAGDRVALVGHSKDGTSYYLREFPQWGSINVPNFRGIDSTKIREQYLDKFTMPRDQLHDGVVAYLDEWALTSEALWIENEFASIREYKEAWAKAPFPPTFNTVDAVVTQGGHVLLIERGDYPGLGLWALPGGFVEIHETLEDAMVRELHEETGLKISPRTMRTCIVKRETYDDPYRSSRGRTFTRAFHVDLDKGPTAELPKVKGSSDARRAFWVPIGSIDPRQMFEDHWFIVCDMLGLSV